MANFELLTRGNPKTVKGERRGYLTFILHLAPHTLSGHNVCPKATKGCIASCLNLAGRGGIFAAGQATNAIQRARLRRTELFFSDRAAFMAALVRDVERAISYAKRRGLRPVFRLNGTSDIRWERVPVVRDAIRSGAPKAVIYPSIMDAFPRVQFYDYTKIANRRDLPSNYALTFSLAENNDSAAIGALLNGMNVAVVFRSPETVARVMAEGSYTFGGRIGLTRPVFNGDESDLRFRDPKGHIIALYAKGPARRDASGFVRD